MKKAKWLSEVVLQVTEERRKEKIMEERERYTQMNAEFQRMARRDKNFFNEGCREIEENNRMGRTRGLFRKIGDIKGTFYVRWAQYKTETLRTLQRWKRFRRCARIHRITTQKRPK